MPEDTHARNSIGERARYWRVRRKLSLRKAAGLAGMSPSYLSMIENGERALDRRSRVAALATALRITTADLTGDPVPADDAALEAAHATLPELRLALLGSTLDEPADVTPRPLAALRAATERVDQLARESDLGAYAPSVPTLITELQVVAARGRRREWREALNLLPAALYGGWYVFKQLGHLGDAYIVGERVVAAAQRAEDPAMRAFGDWLRAEACLLAGGQDRARSIADRSADSVRSVGTPAAQEMYGMLALAAAGADAATRRPDDAMRRLAEAAELAGRLDRSTDAFGLHFGQPNVGAWRVAVAVELGQGGRAVESARRVDASNLPPRRQAALWIDIGRGMAQMRKDESAFTALRRAEDIAPQHVRANPIVRNIAGVMARRARNADDLVLFARRVGAV